MKIGIDLGTSTSEIAYLKDEKMACLVKNTQEGDSVVIPSAVLYDNGNFKVGNIAIKNSILKSDYVMQNIKSTIGIKKKIMLGNNEFETEYICAVIAKRLKEIAEFNLNKDIDEVIVAVPATFNIAQRKATRDSLLIAGFKKVSLINEPTAAAIAYGINLNENGNIVVYDLGGGTFDVSILSVKNNTYKVLGVGGDKNLGGNTVNKVIFDAIVNLFESSMNEKIDLNNKRLLTAINLEVENVKKNLSFEETSSIVINNIAVDEENNSLDLNLDLSRDDLEYLINDVVDRSINIVDDVLKIAGLNRSNIDKVILVGGSTRIPLIRKKLGSLFVGKILNGTNPEEMVAKGAVLSQVLEASDIGIINEKTSNGLGVEIVGGKFDCLINKNESLPITIEKSYKTVEDNQEIAQINIYEGISENIGENNIISSFDLCDIPKSVRGNENINLKFSCNLDGTLDVIAKVNSSGKEENIVLPLEGLSNDAISILKKKLEVVDVFNGSSSNVGVEEEEDLTVEKNEIEKLKKIKELQRIEKERLEQERLEQEKIKQEQLMLEKEKLERERLEIQKRELERIKKEEAEKLERKEAEEKKRLMENSSKNKMSLKFDRNVIKNVIDVSNDKEVITEIKNEVPKQVNLQQASEFIEDYDPTRDSEIYNDVARLIEYFKNVGPQLDAITKQKATELIGDLTGCIKNDNFRLAREKENEIIALIYRG